jgi:hypothetical protein
MLVVVLVVLVVLVVVVVAESIEVLVASLAPASRSGRRRQCIGIGERCGDADASLDQATNEHSPADLTRRVSAYELLFGHRSLPTQPSSPPAGMLPRPGDKNDGSGVEQKN